MTSNIISVPGQYGSKGQSWNAEFVSYMVSIVSHPVYRGMPDAVKSDGKIQWEAPSNRSGGVYQHTHHRRRDWWRAKAESIGIDPTSDQWISETAKRVHPTREKPCKRCGRSMRIAYCYPNGHLQRRLVRLVGADFEYDRLEPIGDLVQRLADMKGATMLGVLPKLLATGSVKPPMLGEDVDAWMAWIEDEYIPSEPSVLSPGAMSNAPDRFDGFHSFNLCCRKKADTGRHDANMRTYTTDRRVFEYWSEGNWIAADRLMGLVNSRFRNERSADGGEGPPSADHIGPLSLGFAHRPEFRLLSKSANTAKNNRMTLWDVSHLREAESRGVSVASWYARPLWCLRKADVVNEETALRLSKMLRDNQRNAMHLLSDLFARRHMAFLASLLDLEFADSKVEFDNLHIHCFVTRYDRLAETTRSTKYAKEQKARRLRIGFESLESYAGKENRHNYLVTAPRVRASFDEACRILQSAPATIRELDEVLAEVLVTAGERAPDAKLRALSARIPEKTHPVFVDAMVHLTNAMTHVGGHLNRMWESDRYVRSTFDFDDE